MTNNKSVWALVLGILSISCCWIVTAIPGIIISVKARKQVKASGLPSSDLTLATTGLVLSILGLIGTILLMIFYGTAFIVGRINVST